MFSALSSKICKLVVSYFSAELVLVEVTVDGVVVSPSGHVVEVQGAGLIEGVVSRNGGGDDVTHGLGGSGLRLPELKLSEDDPPAKLRTTAPASEDAPRSPELS